jgi:hypothetical protein
MKPLWLIIVILCYAAIIIMIVGCVPNVTYKGKYGDYMATPSGFVIVPKYAIESDK